MKEKISSKKLPGEFANIDIKEIGDRIDFLIGKVDKYSNKEIEKNIDKMLSILDIQGVNINEDKEVLLQVKELAESIEKECIKELVFPKEISVNNQPKEIRINNFEEIKSVEVSNLKEFPKEIEVSNLKEFPKEIGIKKPIWYKQVDFSILTNVINSAVQTILKAVFRVDLNEYKKEENALAVKIVGKNGFDFTELFRRLPGMYSPAGSGDGGSSSGGTSDIMSADTPVVSTVLMTDANTEYSQALPNKCRKFMIQNRGNYDIKLSFISGQSGTVYWTIKAGMVYFEDMINCNSKTLFFQCATAAQTAEIIYWTN